MSSSDTTTASATTTILATKTAPPPFSPSLSTSANSAPPPSPCAGCKILRRRCTVRCLLAPFFPPTEPLKFTTAHRVFGAGNIIKLLQELPESRRADAVNSMVYEANARLRDRVYGCAGVICHLQKQVDELQAQLARAQARHVILQAQHAQLFALMATARSQQQRPATDGVVADSCMLQNGGYCVDDCGLGSVWEEEPRWA
ncbi:LOB domain-containing protein [Musa troglodytarum]|uniref:LOB domain-containing protein n=1 Tax=Musa troglodytarum TaxID=320322 RepID=A0A9E7JVI2_9LILI|nr:LOB domain-containing protein [Musa troglodytarum]